MYQKRYDDTSIVGVTKYRELQGSQEHVTKDRGIRASSLLSQEPDRYINEALTGSA